VQFSRSEVTPILVKMSEPAKPSKASQRADEFVSSFGKARTLIMKRIENLKPGDEKLKDVNSKLTVLSNDIQEMSSSLHDATLFLPSYSIKVRIQYSKYSKFNNSI